MAAIFTVTTTIPTERGYVYWPCEFPGVETMDQFAARIIQDRIIVGWKFVPAKGGGWRRAHLTLGIGLIGTVTYEGSNKAAELAAIPLPRQREPG